MSQHQQPPSQGDSDEAAAGTVSRRAALALAAAGAASAAEARWRWTLGPGGAIALRQEGEQAVPDHAPELLTRDELEAVARLADGIIPRTETAGARDAQVHEYIDLSLSVAEESEQERFREGLKWVDERCRTRFDLQVREADTEQIAALLGEISDQQQDTAAAAPGQSFFADLKRRTVFGYYTSLRGRTEELGLPEAVTIERFRGCRHGESETHD